MEKYNNRAIKTKRSPKKAKKESYFYPSLGKVIQAESREEADKIAQKLLTKK